MRQPRMDATGHKAAKGTDVRERVRMATNRPGGKITSSQKAEWMDRIINEEQRKPLKVSEQFVRNFNEQEDEIAERRALEKKRFRQNLKRMASTRARNEAQRMATEAG